MPEKLLRIASDIEVKGPQELMRLTVLKRLSKDSQRLSSFAIFGCPYKSMKIDFYQRVTGIGITNKNLQANAS
jgi:hypothetical protein